MNKNYSPEDIKTLIASPSEGKVEPFNDSVTPKAKVSGEPYRIFVASPGDVADLRRATSEVIGLYNEPHLQKKGRMIFHPYFWETSKVPGFTENYQDDVFKEFGDDCDIFILLLWTSIGSGGTEAEYEKFVNVFKEKNKNIDFWVCLFRKPIDPYNVNIDNLAKLRNFVDKNQSNWAPLGGRRDAIKNRKTFKDELNKQLNAFLQKKGK